MAVKGKTNNPNGRPKGSTNRINDAIRAQFEMFIRTASDDIQDLFDQLKQDNPKQALDAIRDYAEFVLPKLARVESEVNNRYVDKEGNDLHKADKELLKKLGIDL